MSLWNFLVSLDACQVWMRWKKSQYWSRTFHALQNLTLKRLMRYWKATNGSPDSKVHVANMGPTWVLSVPGGPHVGPWTLLSWSHTFIRKHCCICFRVVGRRDGWIRTSSWIGNAILYIIIPLQCAITQNAIQHHPTIKTHHVLITPSTGLVGSWF